jgi:pimeloyl-ACP methyl ester carboxylesterase
MPISPQAYVSRVRDKKTLLVYARYDTTFPVHLSLDLIREFQRLEVPYQLAVLPCGHYTTGLAPFKYVDGYVLTKFLVKNL